MFQFDDADVAHRFIEQRLRPVNIQQDLYRSSKFS